MRCPCCGYEPDEEPEPLWPDLDIKPGDEFAPTVTLDLNLRTVGLREIDSLTDEEWIQLCQAQRDREARVDPNRRGGSW